MKKFGELIRQAMEQKKLNAAALSREVGISETYVGKIHKRGQIPEDDIVNKLIETLSLDRKQTFEAVVESKYPNLYKATIGNATGRKRNREDFWNNYMICNEPQISDREKSLLFLFDSADESVQQYIVALLKKNVEENETFFFPPQYEAATLLFHFLHDNLIIKPSIDEDISKEDFEETLRELKETRAEVCSSQEYRKMLEIMNSHPVGKLISLLRSCSKADLVMIEKMVILMKDQGKLGSGVEPRQEGCED